MEKTCALEAARTDCESLAAQLQLVSAARYPILPTADGPNLSPTEPTGEQPSQIPPVPSGCSRKSKRKAKAQTAPSPTPGMAESAPKSGPGTAVRCGEAESPQPIYALTPSAPPREKDSTTTQAVVGKGSAPSHSPSKPEDEVLYAHSIMTEASMEDVAPSSGSGRTSQCNRSSCSAVQAAAPVVPASKKANSEPRCIQMCLHD